MISRWHFLWPVLCDAEFCVMIMPWIMFFFNYFELDFIFFFRRIYHHLLGVWPLAKLTMELNSRMYPLLNLFSFYSLFTFLCQPWSLVVKTIENRRIKFVLGPKTSSLIFFSLAIIRSEIINFFRDYTEYRTSWFLCIIIVAIKVPTMMY